MSHTPELALCRISRVKWAIAFLFMFLGNILELIGLAAIIPLMSLLSTDQSREFGGIKAIIRKSAEQLLGFLGLDVSPLWLMAIVVCLFLLRSAVSISAAVYVGNLIADGCSRLRQRIVRSLFTLKWEYFRQPRSTHVGLQTVGRVNMISNRLRAHLEMWSSVVQGLLFVILALSISWVMGLGIAAFGTIIFFGFRFLRKEARSSASMHDAATLDFNRELVETIDGIQPLIAMGRNARFQKLFSRQTKHLRTLMRAKIVSSEFLSELQDPIIALFLCGILYFGISILSMPMHEVLVMGLITVRFAGSLKSMQSKYLTLHATNEFFIGFKHALHELDRWRETEQGDPVPEIETSIFFKDVFFSYGDRVILDHLNLAIKSKRLNVIVGKSGGGKSTLLALLLRLEAPIHGSIEVGGVNLTTWSVSSWRRSIGYSPQEVRLFETSIEENISLGDPEIGRKDVEHALRLAEAHEFVFGKELNIDTLVVNYGRSLSGGQRQRLGLARALVHRPAMVILDEPTSGLAHEMIVSICETVRHLVDDEQLTVVVATHDTEWVKYADHLIDLDLLPTGKKGS